MNYTLISNFYLRKLLILGLFVLFYTIRGYAQEFVPFAIPIIDHSLDTIPEEVSPDSIILKRELTYKKYTLKDIFPYGKTKRRIQWSQIRTHLALIENMSLRPFRWGVLQNYKNINGRAPLLRNAAALGRTKQDSLGVSRHQAAPLYELDSLDAPILYARDGWLVINKDFDGDYYRIYAMELKEEFLVPSAYFKPLADSIEFRYAVFIDRKRQYIVTTERLAPQQWSVRSVNPCTTGVDKPPYSQPTPLGMYVLQEKRRRMNYLKDGSNTEPGGFAPHASRFTGGAYIHGVPTVHPGEHINEYSYSLGTVPKSHMCVRNASSHAEFLYKWAPTLQTLIFVIE